jgi:hypothetical protein
MQYKKQSLSAIFMVAVGLTSLKAQETTNASGGNASGSGGSASYSVGQVVYTNNTGAGGSVSQGVQQPYEISIVSGIEEQGITLSCTAYPNPTTDYLTLKIDGDVQTHYSASLFDLNGKLVSKQQIDGNQTTIHMEKYVAGSYILKVIQHNTERKTFTIIKY